MILEEIESIEKIIKLLISSLNYYNKNNLKQSISLLKEVIKIEKKRTRKYSVFFLGDLSEVYTECVNDLNPDSINGYIQMNQQNLNDLKEIYKIYYNTWETQIKNIIFYHGMNSISLQNVKKYGLVVNLVPWDKYEFNKIYDLLIKAGWNDIDLYSRYKDSNSKRKGIYITSSKISAISYAKTAPEIWTHIKSDQENIISILKKYTAKLIGKKYLENKGLMNEETYHEYSICQNLQINKQVDSIFSSKIDYAQIEQITGIKVSQIKEVFAIIEKYFNLFQNTFPMLVQIKPGFPDLKDKSNLKSKLGESYSSFEAFIQFVEENCLNKELITLSECKKAVKTVSEVMKSQNEIIINGKIPKSHIIKYERIIN